MRASVRTRAFGGRWMCVVAALAATAAATCTDPEAFCEGGVYETTFRGQGCRFGPQRVTSSGAPDCPEHAPISATTSDGVACADSEETLVEICSSLARSRGETCGLANVASDPGCLVALTFDGLSCDGLTNLCGGERIAPEMGGRFSGAPGCNGAVSLDVGIGAGEYLQNRLGADWPSFATMGADLDLELRMVVSLRDDPPIVRPGSDRTYGVVFSQAASGFAVVILGGFDDGQPRLAVRAGRCVGDSDGRASEGIDMRPFPEGPTEVRAGVMPNGTAWLEWGAPGGGRTNAAPTDCTRAPLGEPPAGFEIGPFAGTIDSLVLRNAAAAVMPTPTPMPPPMCMPAMMTCPPMS